MKFHNRLPPGMDDSETLRLFNTFTTVQHSEKGQKLYSTYGFPNWYYEMHPLCVGYGPAFKDSFTVNKNHTIENIDLYPLFRHVLGLPTVSNKNWDGDFDRSKVMLKNF